MFTGIIEAVGELTAITPTGDSMRLRIKANGLELDDVALGDSIAVSGPCLTVVWFDQHSFDVDVSTETLARTSLGQRQAGDSLNLEKALRVDARLGGHLVSGHVDGLGEITAREALEDYVRFRVRVAPALSRYIAEKGSVCVDGVSLTVNAVQQHEFDILTIPHTLSATTLGNLITASVVNIEVDLLARYIERLLQHETTDPAGLDLSKLAASGFLGTNGK